MGLRITTNLMSLQAQRHLQRAGLRVRRSLERLSSGLRINRAADDPAGLAISERLRANVRALDVASRNAADGISLVQVADGALDTSSALLIRMRELAVQAQTGTMSDDERAHLDAEFQALKEELTRIAASTEFNGIALLDGSRAALDLQVGVGAHGTITVALGSDASAAGLGVEGAGVGTAAAAASAGDLVDRALDALAGQRAGLGATQNRLEAVIRLNANMVENLSAAESRIRDVDVAREMAESTAARIQQQVATAVLAQAMRQPHLILRLLAADFPRRR